jgi:hypothetical protein
VLVRVRAFSYKTDELELVPTEGTAIHDLSGRVAEVRQLSPVAASVNPDRAIGAKGDYLSGRKCGDLFDLAIPVRP